MFSYGHGRFTSPDPLAASANPIRPQSWNRYSYSYNNPLRYTDPSGMIAGDFYNLDGDKIGKDGKKDDTIYIVYDKDEAKKIEKTEGDYTATVNSKITIANKEVIKAIGRAVDRSNNPTADDKKGGNHEEGVSWKTDNGKTTTTDLKSGGFSDLKKDTKAHIVIPSSTKADGVAHVHPKNTEIVTENGKQYKLSFDQEPSGTDIKAAYPSGTNIVVGARDKKVYFYQATGNNTGSNNCCVAVMKLDNFLKIGGK